MNNYTIYCWAGQSFPQIPYEHQQIIPNDKVWEVIKKIHESGLNVMIYHIPDNREFNFIFVDDKRFQQR